MARAFLIAIVAVVVGYGALVVGNALQRTSRVDTWSGPDASVQSGFALAGCPDVEGLGDETFPAWSGTKGPSMPRPDGSLRSV